MDTLQLAVEEMDTAFHVTQTQQASVTTATHEAKLLRW